MSSTNPITFVMMMIISVSGSTYPNCTDPSTYTSYGESTEYKGLSDNIAWDRTLDSGDFCDFSYVIPIVQPQTCGDCDFELEGDTWYRFDQGPYVEIAEYSDNSSCPARGHCNGFYQIALLSVGTNSGNPNSKMYRIIFSNDKSVSDCLISDNKTMMEKFSCEKFPLYKFPSAWKTFSSICNWDDEGTIKTSPYSLCMTDTIKELTLTANRKYFSEEETLLTCTSEMSPKPPSDLTWKDSDDQDITSQATRDSNLSTLFTEVYNLNSSTLTSVTCQVDDKSHTFYRVSIETENVTGIAGEEVTATCDFSMDKFSPEDEEDLYFIKLIDDSEIYYTTANISSKGDKIVITEKESGTSRAALVLTNTSILENVEIWTEHWSCGLRDPITRTYTTVPFTLTLKKETISKKLIYYLLVGGGVAILVIAIVVVVSCWGRSKRAERKAAQKVTLTDLDSGTVL